MEERKNPKYPAGHRMTLCYCRKCGELHEADCELKHICKKQNSYPKEWFGVDDYVLTHPERFER